MSVADLVSRWPAALSSRARFSEPLSRHTTFRIGGPAEALVPVASAEEARLALETAGTNVPGCPVRFLGRGSNLLVSDQGVPGLTLTLDGPLASWQKLSTSGDSSHWELGAGASLSAWVEAAGQEGAAGVEKLCGIPGTVGGALVMNAGAWGQEFGAVVTSVTLLSRDGQLTTVALPSLRFGYRQSFFPAGSLLLSCRVTLGMSDPVWLIAQHRECLEHRRTRQPLEFPSAGSYYKRTPLGPAGYLIEEAGCKGWRRGDALVSPKHGNFLVNAGHATAADVRCLAAAVEAAVLTRFELKLEPEVIYWE